MRNYDDTLIAPIHAIIALHRDIEDAIYRLLLPCANATKYVHVS